MNQFYRVLVITRQDALAELLTESKNVTPMTEAEKSAVLAKYDRLVTTIDKTNCVFLCLTLSLNFQQHDRMYTKTYSVLM